MLRTPDKDDFLNVIFQIYESGRDDTHKDRETFNLNIDVQRYYAPAINGNVNDELLKLKREFDHAKERVTKQLAELGFIDAKS